MRETDGTPCAGRRERGGEAIASAQFMAQAAGARVAAPGDCSRTTTGEVLAIDRARAACGHAVHMSWGGEAARAAWAQLLGLDVLERVQVVFAPESPLCRRGWIGILGVDGTVTASVPHADLCVPVEEALAGLTAEDAVCAEVIEPRLPATRSVLGPAPLFYPPREYVLGELAGVEHVSHDELEALFQFVTPDELDESGMLEVTSLAFGSRTAEGDMAAVCGYRRWSNDVAHLSVLTQPAHRREGHGRRAALAAIRHAMDVGLLPQWRARPSPSQALARSLGLIEFGAQLNFELA